MTHPHSREVGQRIAAARLQRGLSIRDLALLLGWPRDTLVNFELGRRPITLERLHAIAVVLNLPPAALLVDDHQLADLLVRLAIQPDLSAQVAYFLDTLGDDLPPSPGADLPLDGGRHLGGA